MSDMNVCTFTGRLADTAEVKDVGGKPKGRYRIAINGFKKDSPPLWLTCDHWNIGGVSQFLTKGQRVCVSGELKEESWKGKDGTDRKAMLLNVRNLVLLDSRPADAGPKKVSSAALKWEQDEAPF